MMTKKRRDTFNYARQVELQKYSLLVAVGGDGSYHEVVNGMLSRKDKFKLPIGMIPNGSGNNTCRNLGVFSLDEALKYIVLGQVVALDTIRCLIDHNNVEEMVNYDEEDQQKYCVHMLNQSTLGFPP